MSIRHRSAAGARRPALRPVALAAVVLALATPALGDPRPTSAPQGMGKQCLDTLGEPHAPVCHTQNASRILVDPDICLCGAGLRDVTVPWCEPGERPPPDSAAANRARDAASRGGTLEGASFEGRRFCAPRGRSADVR